MELADQYDVAIIGGGLAGLSSAIELRMAGYNVILFEQEKYPFHKVCGEYISHEYFNKINLILSFIFFILPSSLCILLLSFPFHFFFYSRPCYFHRHLFFFHF